jgi:hypothetical protein
MREGLGLGLGAPSRQVYTVTRNLKAGASDQCLGAQCAGAAVALTEAGLRPGRTERRPRQRKRWQRSPSRTRLDSASTPSQCPAGSLRRVTRRGAARARASGRARRRRD